MSVVTIVGAGVIGLSWARLFAEVGWNVRISDPRVDLEDIVARELGKFDTVEVVRDLAEAATGADFVQESGPERVDVKADIYATLAAHTGPSVVLASSSSSLLPSAFSSGNPAADRILIGHPFNPPQLMPLVEVVPSPQTTSAAADRAIEVYSSLNRQPIRINKEIAGFVGNRLQKVFNDEALYLVQQGVIDVENLDTLVRASLGLRWATIGPFLSQHLGGGPEGIRHLMAHVGAQMTFDAGVPDPSRTQEVAAEVERVYGTGEENYRLLSAQRDSLTTAVLDVIRSETRSE